MLNHNNIPSHLASYIIIGVLLASIMFLCIKVGIYEGDIRTANIVRKWTESENESLKELNKTYVEALQYYQGMLNKAYTLTKDMTLALKEGTLVIPPAETQPDV